MEHDSSNSSILLTSLRKEIKSLLRGGHAHAHFDDVSRDFPKEMQGIVLEGLPYSAWQVLEHMRITQRNMLDFANHYFGAEPRPLKQLRWPRDYWTKQAAPPNDKAWAASTREVIQDRESFEELLDSATTASLVKPPAPRKRRTLLRLSLQIADHDAYHVGQLVIIRRLLGLWKK